MRQSYGFAATALIAVTLAAAACDNGPKNPVITGLCQSGTCPAATDSAYFTITLVSTSCTAKGTTITVTSPVNDKLTGDACYQSVPKTWYVPSKTVGVSAGTPLDFTIISDQTAHAPGFRVTPVVADSTWTIEFEDGGDVDYNDVVLNIAATPLH